MKNSFNLIISPSGQHAISFEAKSIVFPTTDGYMGCMAYRQPMIANLKVGIIKICDISDKIFYYAITGGFYEMNDNEATLICDSLIKPEDLSENAEEAKEVGMQTEATDNISEDKKIVIAKNLLKNKLRSL